MPCHEPTVGSRVRKGVAGDGLDHAHAYAALPHGSDQRHAARDPLRGAVGGGGGHDGGQQCLAWVTERSAWSSTLRTGPSPAIAEVCDGQRLLRRVPLQAGYPVGIMVVAARDRRAAHAVSCRKFKLYGFKVMVSTPGLKSR